MFVEKPPAMRAVEMDELVSLATERDRVLMPGHLLLYHPGVLKVKELIDSGDLGEVRCVYGNRVNLGIVREKENALWSLGVHDLSVILYFLDEDPEFVTAQGSASIHAGRRGRRLLLPALSEREDRAHAPFLARSTQDAKDDRRRSREDGRVRRHGARTEGHRLREAGGARRGAPFGGHLDSRRSRQPSHCDANAPISSSSSAGSTTKRKSRATERASSGRSRC